jgi:hypothetical protein
MALSTDVYWDIDGVPIQTLAYNISTWGGDLQAPPPLRGDDITIPYRPGTVFQMRRPNGRSLTFSMWVIGADNNGNVPTSKTMRAEFENNFKMLRTLFWNQGRQVTITKRWRDYTTGTLMTASGKAVYTNGLAPSMNGSHRATFTVEMYMSDPFFYGSEVTVNFAATATSNQSPTIVGDYETTDILMDFNGARNNMRLTNSSTSTYVNVNQNLASGSLIRLDVNNFTARKNPSTTNDNVVGSVTQFGHPFWMVLRPGVQSLSLTSSSGSGSGVLKYRPRWL